MDSIGLGGLGSEHDIGLVLGASGTHVLLAESLHLLLDGSSSLCMASSASLFSTSRQILEMESPYQLLSQGDLAQLHLVDAGLGGAKQRSCGEESALHAGQY